MKFQVEIPDDQFWKLAAKAEQFGLKVPEYAADLCAVAALSRMPVDTDPVLQLWRGGYTDAQIGNQLALTVAQVKWRRGRFGLPANRKRIREADLVQGAEELARRQAHIKSGAFRLDEQQRNAAAERKSA